MGIKHLREENGSGLVLTLMVLLVLSVLGISIGTLTIGSYRLGAANRDATSAYYVAEAGAVTAYEEIQSQVLGVYNKNATEAAFYESISSMVSALPKLSSVDFKPQFGSKPIATITTARQDEKNYIITSTGEVDGKKRTVAKKFTVNWIEKNTGSGGGSGLPTLPANAVLLTEGDATVVGNTLIGDIYAGGDFHKPNGSVAGNVYANGNVTIKDGTLTGDIYTNTIQEGGFHIDSWIDLRTNTVFHSNKIQSEDLLKYPEWYVNKPIMVAKESVWDGNAYLQSFQNYKKILDGIKTPDISRFEKKSDLIVTEYSGNYPIKIDSSVYIPIMSIIVNPNSKSKESTVSITTDGQNRTIVVDKLKITADKLIVTGGGTLTIVVTDELDISSLPNFNDSQKSVPVNLIFLGTDKNKFKLSGWRATISGNIIVKNNIDIFANSLSIKGIFLTASENVNLTGGNADSNLMLIAPNAYITINEGYSMKGAVIAKQFSLSGGASLTHGFVDTTNFPFGSSAPDVDPKPGDLINSEPIIEN
ncbi:hypothetical protein SDC9_63479 [bioreactor metagenome]|uniref:Type 4 fimbrial biogenesis protein PilX N-terminal domain-containing protein n=1 Tax=bioreactor metagenome TaxID=1076179 RepID=A0A644XLN5_9ZZZZ